MKYCLLIAFLTPFILIILASFLYRTERHEPWAKDEEGDK